MFRKIKNYIKNLGPGLITGASDDDPSGIATYSQTGAQFGFGQLWMAFAMFPMMAAVQEMCARIGMVTGHGLAGVIRKNYPRAVLYIAASLLLIANIINIGADIGALSAALELLLPKVLVVTVFSKLFIPISFTALILILEIIMPYRSYSKFLKWLTLSLLAYVLTALVVGADWLKIAVSSFLPHIKFDKIFFLVAVGVLGTTISPYLFFWQASEEVEEEIAEKKITSPGIKTPLIRKDEIKSMRVDVISGMFLSEIVAWFIIITTASTLFKNGITDIGSAQQAAAALEPLVKTFPHAGYIAKLLFAIGIIGTGLLAIPVLSGSAAYALSEGFGWKEGLYRKFKQAHGFYGVIILATLIGLLINFMGFNPIKALVYAAVINGVVSVPLLVIIMFVCNNPKVMGERYINKKLSNWLGWITTAFVASAVFLMFFFMFR